jgi:hypothetical protein
VTGSTRIAHALPSISIHRPGAARARGGRRRYADPAGQDRFIRGGPGDEHRLLLGISFA